MDNTRRLVTAVAALLLALAAGSSALAASGSGSSGSGGGSSGGGAADFTFGANYNPPFFVGHLVRGGLFSCAGCTSSIEPRYVVTGFTRGWDSNTLSSVSLNGFSGTVAIEVTGLPFGVTSETATSVFVPSRGVGSTALRLRAASFAAPGTATITVRASAAGKVHAIELPISVADALPAS